MQYELVIGFSVVGYFKSSKLFKKSKYLMVKLSKRPIVQMSKMFKGPNA